MNECNCELQNVLQDQSNANHDIRIIIWPKLLILITFWDPFGHHLVSNRSPGASRDPKNAIIWVPNFDQKQNGGLRFAFPFIWWVRGEQNVSKVYSNGVQWVHNFYQKQNGGLRFAFRSIWSVPGFKMEAQGLPRGSGRGPTVAVARNCDAIGSNCAAPGFKNGRVG